MSAICGILGAWAAEPDAGTHLDAMLAALDTGGPDRRDRRDGRDGRAAWADPSRACRLGVAGATRILERGELAAACDGHLFDGAGGPDGLLGVWARDGVRGLRGADAQFALAVWDAGARTLTLARDALGVRSVYYHEGRGGLVFASTIEALLRHPRVPRAHDVRSVSYFLTFLDVPAPGTLFEGIAKLPPGAFAVCRARGVDRIDRYWNLLDDPLPDADDAHHYASRARELHEVALEGRLVAGPMGALLSGGNDSSANVALMTKLGVAPLHTFTVGLADTEGDERFSDLVHARRVAQLTGTVHHERLLTVDEFIAAMPRVTDALDDLVSEPSSVFLHHALEMVRDRGLSVVITGEANDEVSCGHGGMVRIHDGYHRRWRPLMRMPRAVRRMLAAAAPVVSPRHGDVLGRAAADGEYFWSYEIGWTDHDKADILTPAAYEQTFHAPASAVVAERAAAIRRAREDGDGDYLQHIIAMMMQDHYLGNLMLGKLELLSRRLGIEARCPYTSPAYVHFVYNIPRRFKVRGGQVKAFFKAAIRDLLPHDIIHRPKQGFRTPTPELFRGRFGTWAEPILLDAGLTRAGVLRRETLARLLAEHRRGGRDVSTRLWTALVLNLWHERWVTA
ncbi:MAG: hypothetical protein KIT31_08495 [Deltaproteobacteria bacterium]|nr:hypothetical protein [Deltaproteobacteria bacterium]